jgi:predicted enzyme related to lactoylglutathione lyase
MKFMHTNIAARDWKTLSNFYIKVFRCKIRPPERKLSGRWLDQAMGLPNVKLEGVHLLLPGYEADGPTLEIFSYQDACDCEPCMPNRTGLTHIAFEVDDVDRTLTDAIKNGAQPLGKVARATVVGACELKFVYFRDPEGNIIKIQSQKRWKRRASKWSSANAAALQRK